MDISVINEKELGAAIAAGLAPKVDELRDWLDGRASSILADTAVALLHGRQLHATVTVGDFIIQIDVRLEPGVYLNGSADAQRAQGGGL